MVYENAVDIIDFSMSKAISVLIEGDNTILKMYGVRILGGDKDTSATVTFRDLHIEGYLADDLGTSHPSLAGDEAKKQLRDALIYPVTVFSVYDYIRANRYYLTADIGASEGIVTIDISFRSVTVDFSDGA